MKVVNIVLLFLCFCIAPANAAEEEIVKLRHYVDGLIDKGYEIVNNKTLSNDEKVKRSSELIKANLHLDWMANYSLGRNKKSLSPSQIKEFSDVYSQFVVHAYSGLVESYKGEKAVVKKINRVDNNMFIVNLEIVKPDSSSPVKVDYLIHKLENNAKTPYKVADIITEGVSILNSQQAEFNSVITSKGIDALIADLKIKSTQHKEK